MDKMELKYQAEKQVISETREAIKEAIQKLKGYDGKTINKHLTNRINIPKVRHWNYEIIESYSNESMMFNLSYYPRNRSVSEGGLATYSMYTSVSLGYVQANKDNTFNYDIFKKRAQDRLEHLDNTEKQMELNRSKWKHLKEERTKLIEKVQNYNHKLDIVTSEVFHIDLRSY